MNRESNSKPGTGYDALRRAAYHLQALASLGQLAVLLFWIFASVALYAGIGSMLTWPAPMHAWAEGLRTDAGRSAVLLIPLVLAPAALAAIWLLSRLHALARVLYRGEPISPAVSQALAGLARAILGYLIVATFAPPFLAELVAATGYPLTLGFSSWYLGLIAYLCLRAMSLLVAEANRISDENKAFV
ncbi:MAG TPA: hypothetical protein VFY12_12900 [Arenimonas sp.]|nr:hypothetical protein [Arenimonas sp.]